MTSFSLDDYSGIPFHHLLRTAALVIRALISWLLSSSLFLLHSPPSSPRRTAKAIKDSLRISAYADLHRSSTHETCVVCLVEMQPRDEVRVLCNCDHVFHRGCLERWLDHDDRGTCPLCRTPLLRSVAPEPPPEPSWEVERLLYLFGDDMMIPCPL